MIEVPVPSTIGIAGYDYWIVSNLETDQELYSKNVWADHCPWERRIRILSTLQGQEWSNSFIHEMMEAVANLYLAADMDHDKLSVITNGLHQVFENVGVRFVPRKESQDQRSSESQI